MRYLGIFVLFCILWYALLYLVLGISFDTYDAVTGRTGVGNAQNTFSMALMFSLLFSALSTTIVGLASCCCCKRDE